MRNVLFFDAPGNVALSVAIWVLMYCSGAGCCLYAQTTLTPPTLTAPTNGASIQTRIITFSWSSVSGANSYRLQISSVPFSSQTTSLLLDTQISSTSQGVDFNGVTPGSTVYWRVRANSTNAVSEYSTAFSFIYNIPTPPQLNVSVSNLSFPSPMIGDFRDLSLSMSVPTSSTSPVSGVVHNNTGSNDFTVISGSGQFTLQPGQSKSITVRFTPSDAGNFKSAFSISHNGSGAAKMITLIGAATKPTPTNGIYSPPYWATVSTLPTTATLICATTKNLYIGTPTNGVYRSDDEGKTWKQQNTGLNNLSIICTMVHGANVWVGTKAGLYYSTNNGDTWKIPVNLPTKHVGAITSDKNSLYVFFDSLGIYRSVNNGETWGLIANLPTTKAATSMASNGETLYTNRGNLNLGDYVWSPSFEQNYSNPMCIIGSDLIIRSPNTDHSFNPAGGQTRSDSYINVVRANYSTSVPVLYTSTVVTFSCVDSLLFGTNGGLIFSKNNGVSWQTLVTKPQYTPYGTKPIEGSIALHSQVVLLNKNLFTIAQTNTGYKLIRTTLEETLTFSVKQPPITSTKSVDFGTVIASEPEKNYIDKEVTITNPSAKATLTGKIGLNQIYPVYGYTQSTHLDSLEYYPFQPSDSLRVLVKIMSGDGDYVLGPGQSHTVKLRFFPQRTLNLQIPLSIQHDAVQNPPTTIQIPILAQAKGVWEGTGLNKGLPSKEILSVTNTESSIFVGTNGGGLFRSNDDGKTWLLVNTGSLSSTVTTALSSRGNRIIAATFSGIIQSLDNGTTWSLVHPGLGTTTNPVDIVQIVIQNSSLLAAAVSSGYIRVSGLYRSADNGRTWNIISGLSGSQFIQAGSSVYVNEGSIIKRSDDEGITWKDLSLGLTETFPRMPIRIAFISGNDKYLYAISAENNRLYRSGDKGETWEKMNVHAPGLPAMIDPSTNQQKYYYSSVFTGGNNTVFLGLQYLMERFYLIRSDDNGLTWRDNGSGLPSGRLKAGIVKGENFVGTFKRDGTNWVTQEQIYKTVLNAKVTAIDVQNKKEQPLVRLIPNHTSDYCQLHYNVDRSSPVNIMLYDILGNLKMKVFQGVQPAGIYDIPLNVSEFTSGFYYCRITIGEHSAICPLQIVR